MKLELAYYGNPVLRKKAAPIKEINATIHKLVEDMIETLHAHNGIGLAAPQVNQSLQLFISIASEEDDNEMGDVCVYINPVLSDPSLELQGDRAEGCLSIPGVVVNVFRPYSITVEAMGLDGKIFYKTLSGLAARVVMHENDHLNGVLHIDRADKKDRALLEPLLKRVKKKFNP